MLFKNRPTWFKTEIIGEIRRDVVDKLSIDNLSDFQSAIKPIFPTETSGIPYLVSFLDGITYVLHKTIRYNGVVILYNTLKLVDMLVNDFDFVSYFEKILDEEGLSHRKVCVETGEMSKIYDVIYLLLEIFTNEIIVTNMTEKSLCNIRDLMKDISSYYRYLWKFDYESNGNVEYVFKSFIIDNILLDDNIIIDHTRPDITWLVRFSKFRQCYGDIEKLPDSLMELANEITALMYKTDIAINYKIYKLFYENIKEFYANDYNYVGLLHLEREDDLT